MAIRTTTGIKMGGWSLFLWTYVVTTPFVWYSLTTVFATNAQLCFPKWRHFAYNATGASLVGGFLIAIIPYFGWIAFAVGVLIWLLSSRNVSGWLASHPLRK
jgi:hypothetical protein